MEKILITGGAGYVGSHITLNILKRGLKVIVLDSFVNSSKDVFNNFCKVIDKKILKRNFKIITGDIRNKNLLNDIFEDNAKKECAISSVIHCAGLKSVQTSIINPKEYWDVNVLGTMNLVDIMESYSCKKIIFSSSATVYDPSEGGILDENSRISPINPYGSTKFVVEKFLEDIHKSSKNEWKCINLRYFNPIGANPEGIIGESPLKEKNNIFPLIMDVASKKLEKFTIFGNDWDSSDGTCVRDYIHIDDLAESHIKALEYLNNNTPVFMNLNVGTGEGTSVLELIKKFEETNQISIPFIYGERRKGDFGTVVADNRLAKKVLAWIPKKDLKDMCKDGWNWFSNTNI